MMCNAWPKSMSVALAVLAALLSVECRAAEAQTVPFGVSGAGVVEFVPLPGQSAAHFANGTATYLGHYMGQGAVQVLTLDPKTGTGTFQSAVPFVFKGQHGTLAYHYGRPDQGASSPGIVQIIPAGQGKVIAVWDAEFTLAAPAGKVVASKFRMIAITAPFVPGTKIPVRYSWSGTGSITFAP